MSNCPKTQVCSSKNLTDGYIGCVCDISEVETLLSLVSGSLGVLESLDSKCDICGSKQVKDLEDIYRAIGLLEDANVIIKRFLVERQISLEEILKKHCLPENVRAKIFEALEEISKNPLNCTTEIEFDVEEYPDNFDSSPAEISEKFDPEKFADDSQIDLEREERLNQFLRTFYRNSDPERSQDDLNLETVIPYLVELQRQKGRLYGRSYCNHGDLSIFMNLERKWDRLTTMMSSAIENGVKGLYKKGSATESFVDTVADLATYGLLWLGYICETQPNEFHKFLQKNGLKRDDHSVRRS